MRNRISSLPIAEFCGLAPTLDKSHGAGRAAIMSTAFHASCAGEKEKARDTMLKLTSDELNEISTWKKPTDVQIGKHTLRYQDSVREAEVYINVQGEKCIGHSDFYWILDGVAYVGDIKRSEWTVSDPSTLQLLGYGLAIAQKHDCTSFACGIWAAVEGTWMWTKAYDMFFDVDDIKPRIDHAAMNESKTGQVGSHCSGCYSRMHCPEYLLPVSKDSWLAPLSEHGALTRDNALQLLQQAEVADKVVKAIKTELREYARRTGGIVDIESGKLWRQYTIKGREQLPSVAEVRANYPELADKLISRGPPGVGFGWRKP